MKKFIKKKEYYVYIYLDPRKHRSKNNNLARWLRENN
jgi:hypothetical protein